MNRQAFLQEADPEELTVPFSTSRCIGRNKPMNDTIAAIATAPGEGGISIIRLSGPDSERILQALFRPAGVHFPLTSHMLTYGHILHSGEIMDECMAVIMRAPRSYTREDVAELQIHGGFFLARKILGLCLELGARLAEPGEFTRRAFLNGRISLSQAEAVMSLISARGEQARRAAVHDLQGGVSSFIASVSESLYQIQAGLAAALDYPEEISDEEALSDLKPRMLRLAEELDQACREKEARLVREGLHVALCGRPNVGKSSLLNALLGEERAIVTDVPGTTRDLVDGTLNLSGVLVRITDTAGLHDSDDPVERLGIERARNTVKQSDLVMLVLDGGSELTDEDRWLMEELKDQEVLVLINKTDLPVRTEAAQLPDFLHPLSVMEVSAMQPETLQPLRSFLQEKATVTDTLVLSQPRHMDAARRAARHLRNAAEAMDLSADFATLETDAAQAALAEITGDQVEEKLLDHVFSTFCVGK